MSKIKKKKEKNNPRIFSDQSKTVFKLRIKAYLLA